MSGDLRELLVQAGDRRTGAGAAVLLDRVERQLAGEPTTGLIPPSRPRFPGWIVAAAAAAAAAILLGVPFLLLSKGPPDVAAPPPEPDTTQAPATSALDATEPPVLLPPPPATGSLDEGWYPVLEADSPDLWGVAAAGRIGIVAVGWGGEPSTSFVAFSPDGDEWMETGTSIRREASYLLDLAASEDAIVAVGGTCETQDCPQEQAIWHSTDGVSWQRVPVDGTLLYSCDAVEAWWECFAAIDEVASYPGGFLATGWRSGDRSALGPPRSILASEDGWSWTPLTAPDLADLGHPDAQAMLEDPTTTVDLTLRPVGRIADRWLLWIRFSVRSESGVLEMPGGGEAWETISMMAVSVDGATWDPVPAFDDPDGRIWVGSSVVGPDHMVVVGSSAGSAAAWITPDGSSWTAAEMGVEADGGRMVTVATTPDGYVAVGEANVIEYSSGDGEPEVSGSGPTLWRSESGSTWVSVDLEEMSWTRFGSIAATGSSLFAAGSQWPPEGGGFTGVWRHDLPAGE